MKERSVAVACVLTSSLNGSLEMWGLVLAIFERYRIRTCRKSWFDTVFTVVHGGFATYIYIYTHTLPDHYRYMDPY